MTTDFKTILSTSPVNII